MSEPEIERVLSAYRDRILDLKQDRRLRHILVFKNHGAAAGATLEHSHSQLIALPIVPDFVREELDGARRHFAEKERCVFCDIVRQELADRRRVIIENADIVALAPYAPRFAFETWLLPKRHAARFEHAPRHEYESLARLLKALLQRMDRALELPAYNLIVHTSPFSEDTAEVYHWHLELMPKLTPKLRPTSKPESSPGLVGELAAMEASLEGADRSGRPGIGHPVTLGVGVSQAIKRYRVRLGIPL